ncbi:MAG: histidine phosphatase family protein [Burkholderiaceae bacterium]|nr:histidine phosphatase family protein [Sulfuritalea sp.]MCF8174188.1 histidine phosphatase family protein [Burkholderiaceae bacterium]
MSSRNFFHAGFQVVLGLGFLLPHSAGANDSLWQAIAEKPNVVIVMRHTEAEGGRGAAYDPSGRCAGESMLTPRGIREAELVGKLFREHGVEPRVVGSAMCRTRDTARLAFGAAELDPQLRESASGDAVRFQEFLAAASGWIRKYRGARPLVLVTHLPNIDSLTGEQPVNGEAVVATADDKGELDVLGRLVLYQPR